MKEQHAKDRWRKKRSFQAYPRFTSRYALMRMQQTGRNGTKGQMKPVETQPWTLEQSHQIIRVPQRTYVQYLRYVQNYDEHHLDRSRQAQIDHPEEASLRQSMPGSEGRC